MLQVLRTATPTRSHALRAARHARIPKVALVANVPTRTADLIEQCLDLAVWQLGVPHDLHSPGNLREFGEVQLLQRRVAREGEAPYLLELAEADVGEFWRGLDHEGSEFLEPGKPREIGEFGGLDPQLAHRGEAAQR